ncbi:uncharacterized protein [Rutidosis leptorrhynchoides]|uniref:uncharacterized protein n=1 Tax=Rutidosis leptorrhynchoides TaxID=125765 RepID=UPI003A99FD1B
MGDLTVEQYFRKVDSIAAMLTNLGSTIASDELVTYAINGLNDRYPHATHIILHNKEFPDLDTVRSMITLEEMQLKRKTGMTETHGAPSAPTALITQNPPPQTTSVRQGPYCQSHASVYNPGLAQPNTGSVLGPYPHTSTLEQETTLPNAFSTMTLQDFGNAGWHMDLTSSINSLSTIFNHCMYPSVAVGNGNTIPVINTGHSMLPNIHRPLPPQ